MKKLRATLRQLRKQKKITQSDLADLIGVTQAMISRFELSKDLYLSTVEKIAMSLDMCLIAVSKNFLSDIERLIGMESKLYAGKPKTLLDIYGIKDDEE